MLFILLFTIVLCLLGFSTAIAAAKGVAPRVDAPEKSILQQQAEIDQNTVEFVAAYAKGIGGRGKK